MMSAHVRRLQGLCSSSGARARGLKLHGNQPLVPTFLVFAGFLCRGTGTAFSLIGNPLNLNNKGDGTRRIGGHGLGGHWRGGDVPRKRLSAGQPKRGSVRLPFDFKAVGKLEVDDEWDFECAEDFVLQARLAPADPVPEQARRCSVSDATGRESFLVTRSYKVQEIPESLHDGCYRLLKENMYDMYEESTWGWNEPFKRREHANPFGRFITVTRGGEPSFGPMAGALKAPELLAYVNYRYELLDNTFTNTTSAVLYVHELQVSEKARRQGLGKHLMMLMDQFAEEHRMDKLMLCVFRYNDAAVSFYRERMNFVLDDSSRFNSAQEDVYELCKFVGARNGKVADPPLR